MHRIYCVGRNYAAHAVEMGHDPNKEPPFFFQKNPDNLDTSGEFPYPPASNDVHHEIEMVVALKSGGIDIPVGKGARLRLRLWRRPRHDAARPAGQGEGAWAVHGRSARPSRRRRPARRSCRRARSAIPTQGAVWLDVNGERRQTGDLNQMIWKVPEMISYLSGLFTLAPGDIIMSGTPAGVGAVKRGDVLKGHVDGVGDIEVRVV